MLVLEHAGFAQYNPEALATTLAEKKAINLEWCDEEDADTKDETKDKPKKRDKPDKSDDDDDDE